MKGNFTATIKIYYYGKKFEKTQDKVAEVMQEFKEGKLKSGQGGKGGKVKSRKQAIVIGLSEAREAGEIPEKETKKKTEKLKK